MFEIYISCPFGQTLFRKGWPLLIGPISVHQLSCRLACFSTKDTYWWFYIFWLSEHDSVTFRGGSARFQAWDLNYPAAKVVQRHFTLAKIHNISLLCRLTAAKAERPRRGSSTLMLISNRLFSFWFALVWANRNHKPHFSAMFRRN